jgi:hypothetical protein
MFILIRLTQHVPGIIMPIVRRADYINTACGVWLVVLAAVVQSWDTSCVHCAQCISHYQTPSFILLSFDSFGNFLHCYLSNIYVCTVHFVLDCTVLHCTALYCSVLYCTVLHCTALYCTVLHCTVVYCTALYCTVLYCTVRYCTLLYCTVLYCAIL